jgi:hypothetical protein
VSIGTAVMVSSSGLSIGRWASDPQRFNIMTTAVHVGEFSFERGLAQTERRRDIRAWIAGREGATACSPVIG